MKKMIVCLSFVFVALFLNGEVVASVTNPNPVNWNDDDNASFFNYENQIITFEIFDLGGYIGPSEFGFFFAGSDPTNPANRIPIYDPLDQYYPDVQNYQFASVDFVKGIVWDLDKKENNLPTVQGLFSPASAPIGFYYNFEPFNIDIYSMSFYTDTSLNPLGSDVGTFMSKLDSQKYLMAFVTPGGKQIAYEYIAGISPVPLPASVVLLGSGLLGCLSLGRRKRS
ncbi:MAG: hypothetical protein ACD_13C00023G0003 [uncultured bacterium]|nr:MAG: hypothetical protein ACD_13C00023G0003 [uncultured bacterium]